MGSVRQVASAIALSILAGGVLAGCGGHADAKKPHRPKSSHNAVAAPTALTLGVFGTAQEIASYQQVVSAYDAQHSGVTITMETWPSAAAMMTDLAAGKPTPDVFLAGREDLTQLQQDRRISPLDELLAARDVDLGDGYSREALEAFSSDRHLQCMPYAATPEVLYYNTDLVNFPAMKLAGLPTPTDLDSGKWTASTFTAAVQYATESRRKIRGFYLPPTIEGLAPYLYSGHGKVFDDETAPTSLTFSDPGSQAALQQLLPALAVPDSTLTPKQLEQGTPLHWFERGKLAMMVGDRSLVPELRQHAQPHWDVISLPSVSGTTTIGDYTGLCLSSANKERQASADLLAYLVSDSAEAQVAQLGSIVPVNSQVAFSDDFLQPTQQPAHAQVFVNSIRAMHVLPISSDVAGQLDTAVGGLLTQLLAPGADVAGISQQIDATSQPLLRAALPTQSASDSPSTSASVSGSPAG